jgi:hypothetical protein
LQDRHNHPLPKQEVKVVIGSSATLNKNSSGAAAPASNLADEILVVRILKAHLANCQCCAAAVKSDLENITTENNIEVGYLPTPDYAATTHTQRSKLRNVSYK